MGSIKIEDDCLAPRPRLKMFYTGKDPFKVATGIEEVFKPYFRISTSKSNMYELKWDDVGQNYEFTILYWVFKDLSRYTKMKLEIRFQGDQDKETKKGNCRIEVKSKLEHTFPENWVVRSLFFLYNLLFYNKIRQDYLMKCRSLTEGFVEVVKDKYGMRPSSSQIPQRFPSQE